ncbi:hypothetical protein [Caballeronia hypogeia]|uniref:hypothetical protein n=1 Tax=Caballeronia hypogeia TaxID=1777140 RepID=UPI0012FE5D7E|nr:hypothetical protein [Caballeronia hypogeia]
MNDDAGAFQENDETGFSRTGRSFDSQTCAAPARPPRKMRDGARRRIVDSRRRKRDDFPTKRNGA